MTAKLIGTKDFYRKTLRVAIPIMIQNGITNFVGMLDNIMIGRVGTDEMSGVAIVNQLLFVWNLCVFGGLAGIGIFTSQFSGKGDKDGVRQCMRLMLWVSAVIFAVGFLILYFGGGSLVTLYLHEDTGGGDPARTYAFAMQYLTVMFFNMLPFALSQTYSSTLRSTGETLLPMKAGLLAVAVNLCGNYILIYGKLGAPALGVVGAALATVISRFVELAFVSVSTHRQKAQFSFVEGLYKSLRVPLDLVGRCLKKGTPLLLNEAFWAGGQAVLMQQYSLRGLTVVGAMNISQAVSNVFVISFIAMGNAIAILIGQQLGAGKLTEAKEDAGKHIFFSVCLCIVTGLALLAIAPFFPRIYNTTPDVRTLATSFIRVAACCMPMHAFLNACYFILRSGGKTIITFLFDSCYCWIVSIPVAFFLVRYTMLPVAFVYLSVQLADALKCVIGYILVHRGIWVNNIVSYRDE